MSDERIVQNKSSIVQVLGAIIKKPELLHDSSYLLKKTDFPEKFHKIVFSSMNNLVKDGIIDIDEYTVDGYLKQYPEQYAIFEKNNGVTLIQNYAEIASVANFQYHYNNVKKYSLLRDLQANGIDISEFYDLDEVETITCTKMMERLNECTLQDILNHYNKKIIEVQEDYLEAQGIHGQHAGKNLKNLKESLKLTPEIGSPLFSKMLNAITRGARLKKLYMRSAPQGLGKTRLSIADACNLAINEIYDIENKKWIANGESEATLFITTELDMEEIGTMLMAFVSGVKEEHILDGRYHDGEEERVDKAIEIIENSLLYLEHVPNFDITDIENSIKKYALTKNIKYVFFDYVHTTMKLLSQLANQSKGMRLREDNVLLMFIDKLKTLCNELGIFIFTASQVNGEWKTTKDPDQNLLRGAKAMADKLDVGIIALLPSKADMEGIKPIIAHNGIKRVPNMCYHVYKNRRGKIVRVIIWVYVDLSTCRTYDCFLTDKEYRPLDAEVLEIFTKDDTEELTEEEKKLEEDIESVDNESCEEEYVKEEIETVEENATKEEINLDNYF
jgi:replicative DNA helicase